jgi:hypothetical protein
MLRGTSWLRIGVCVFAFAACGFPRPSDVPGDANIPIDAPVCFGVMYPICLAAPPSAPLTISSDTTINTDRTDATIPCAETASGGDHYCVIAGTTIDITASVRATGSKPLVLLAATSITTSAAIDVGSEATACSMPRTLVPDRIRPIARSLTDYLLARVAVAVVPEAASLGPAAMVDRRPTPRTVAAYLGTRRRRESSGADAQGRTVTGPSSAAVGMAGEPCISSREMRSLCEGRSPQEDNQATEES